MKKIILFIVLCLGFFSSFSSWATDDNVTKKIDETLEKLTPAERSALEERLAKTRKANDNPFAIAFYRPTYVMPFYYTGSPYSSIYRGHTPSNQNIMHSELKAQLSFVVPVFPQLFGN